MWEPTTIEIQVGQSDPDWDRSLITGESIAAANPGKIESILTLIRLSTQAHRNRLRVQRQIEEIDALLEQRNQDLVAERDELLGQAEGFRTIGNELEAMVQTRLRAQDESAIKVRRTKAGLAVRSYRKDEPWDSRLHNLDRCLQAGRHPGGEIPGCHCHCHERDPQTAGRRVEINAAGSEVRHTVEACFVAAPHTATGGDVCCLCVCHE